MQFKDVVGQGAVKQSLVQSVKENRVSHGLLFAGYPGAGNLPLALAFAQYVLCENPGEADSCGVCPNCKKTTHLAHPDVHFTFPIILKKGQEHSAPFMQPFREMVLDDPYLSYTDWMDRLGEILKKQESQERKNKQGLIGVTESYEIIRQLSLKSYEGGYKILVIWLPEYMNVQAASKLLKTLEEPSPRTLILLVSEAWQNFLPTIISRVQHISVPRIHPDELAEYLTREKQVKSETAWQIAHMSDGSLREAKRQLTDGEEEADLFHYFRNWMRICYKADVVAAHDYSDALSKENREKQKRLLLYSLHILRQCLSGTYSGPDFMQLEGEEKKFARDFSPFVIPSIIPLSELLNEAHFHLERNGNPKCIFMDLSFRTMRLIHTSKRKTARAKAQ